MTADHGDLSGRTSRGAVLTLAGNLLVKGLSVVLIAVVAATLDAGSYGHAILALAVFGFAEVITNPALPTTLIRTPDLRDPTIDVAWTVSVLRGLGSSAALWCTAPWVASFWPAEAVLMTSYFRVLACSFAIAGFANMHAIRLRRDLRFGRAFLVDSAGPFAGTCSVILALLLTGEAVWIVVGPLVAAIVATFTSLAFVRPLPRLHWDRDEFSRLWRFSRPLMLSAMMIFVLLNGDDIFISSIAGFTALGVYAMSFRWSNTGVNLVVHGLQNVLTPAYVKMRDDPARLRHAVIASLSILTTACALISGLFLAFADEFFACLSGSSEWLLAAPVARALVPFVLSRGINAALAPVFIVLGKPHWSTAMTACQLVLFLPAMYLGHAWLGLPGIALGVAVLSLATAVLHMAWLRKLLAIDAGAFAAALIPAFATTGLGVLLGWLSVLGVTDPTWRMVLGGSIAVLMFLLLWELFCRQPLAKALPQRSFFELFSMLNR